MKHLRLAALALRVNASLLALGLVLAAPAFAVTGTPPGTGFALPDGAWLNGLANGQNFSYVYGLTAVGTNQATALALTPGFYLYEIDTAGAGGATGVALPPCLQGTSLWLSNNTAYTIDVYPAVLNNPVTAAQDVINVGSAATSTTITTYASKVFACAKNGIWTVK